MVKQMVFDEEARQLLAGRRVKLARAVRSTLGPRGRNAVLDKGWGSPKVTKDGVTVAENIELDDPLREPRGPARQGSRQQDQRRGRRRHHHRHGPGRGHLQGRPEDDRRRRRPDGPVARHRQGHRGGQRRHPEAGHADQRKEQEGDHAGRHDRRQQRPVDRQRAGRSVPEGRQGRRHHGRRGPAVRDDRRSRRGDAVRPRLSLAALRHQPG